MTDRGYSELVSAIEANTSPKLRSGGAQQSFDPGELYLNLLKACLTRTLFETETLQPWHPAPKGLKSAVLRKVETLFANHGVVLRTAPVQTSVRREGRDWPADAETMIGLLRLNNIQECVTSVVREGIPGDLIETGVWRGGAAIFMRAVLASLADSSRTVWVADSFEGLPKPDAERYPVDDGDDHWKKEELKVSLDTVRSNFARYGFLDERVRFLKGWFKDTLPTAPIGSIAVARLDGDMYESTMDALVALHPKVSLGGYVIIDDFGNESTPGCRAAVTDFRQQNDIKDLIQPIDWTGVYWRKTAL